MGSLEYYTAKVFLMHTGGLGCKGDLWMQIVWGGLNWLRIVSCHSEICY
jgi:hypothetical protein